jgi:hypothetical protein
MIEPTAEDLAKLRAVHGDGMRLTPPFRAGLEQVRLVMRVFDQASFDRYYDESASSPETAAPNAFLRHLLWPTREVCARLAMACASLPSIVLRALEALAHGGVTGTTFEPLEATTSDAVLSAAGLDRAQAETLIAQAAQGGVPLELVILKKGSGFVIRAPEPVIFESLASAMRAKKGLASAARVAAVQSTAWCSDGDATAVYKRLPGLAAHVVMPALLRLGGAGAEHTFCFDD